MEGKTKNGRAGRFFSYSLHDHPSFLLDIIKCEQCLALFAFNLAVGVVPPLIPNYQKQSQLVST